MFFLDFKPLIDIEILEDITNRYGIIDNKQKKIYISCILFKNNDKFYLLHFKEGFGIYSFINENKIETEKIKMDNNDFIRRNNLFKLFLDLNYIEIDNHKKKYIEENSDLSNPNFEILNEDEVYCYDIIKKMNFEII
jgi:hypothetical protein